MRVIIIYNNSYHSTLKTAPNKLTKEMIQIKRMEDAEHNAMVEGSLPIQIGDTVRKLNKKEAFGKTSENWSKKLYRVVEKIGNRYKIVNMETKRPKRLLVSHNELLKVHNVIQPTTTKKKQVVRQYRTQQKILREGALDPIQRTKRTRKQKRDSEYEYY